MTRTIVKYPDEIQPGDLLWVESGGKRVKEVTPADEEQRHGYTIYTIKFIDGTAMNKSSLTQLDVVHTVSNGHL
jgi:hypothetical protein